MYQRCNILTQLQLCAQPFKTKKKLMYQSVYSLLLRRSNVLPRTKNKNMLNRQRTSAIFIVRDNAVLEKRRLHYQFVLRPKTLFRSIKMISSFTKHIYNFYTLYNKPRKRVLFLIFSSFIIQLLLKCFSNLYETKVTN